MPFREFTALRVWAHRKPVEAPPPVLMRALVAPAAPKPDPLAEASAYTRSLGLGPEIEQEALREIKHQEFRRTLRKWGYEI